MPRLPVQIASLLRCPLTGSALEQIGDTLVSLGTDEKGQRLSYPISEGIPILLTQEAQSVPN
ncbi:hypothetical protein CQ018_13910 [Arthrobacter sp. MYb227]|uniref:hypothetical protein n=1 Tax=Arthrobacter sp. MYb227 TaxID=1848601 RepID=UPI000CFB4F7E|nr:hypothetical protein [Arthrobacter sp. MYb227]PQZ91059.1 hypothetical protein CQ018_13910 [Arthrobacter sp. MYb227]